MRKQPIKIAIWGFGAMGSGMATMLLDKQGFEIVGVCDRNPAYLGKSMYSILKRPVRRNDVIIVPSIEAAVQKGQCDLVLLATDSFTKKAFPKLEWLMAQGVDIITTAEEMAFPKAKEPLLAKKIDELAKANGVTVLGTGVNPGVMMDLLVVMLTGVMEHVDKIEVSRINSLSPYGPTVMEEQGVGLTPFEFMTKMAAGELAGHVGFHESVGMISEALGLHVTQFRQTMSPIITDIDRKSTYGYAKRGNVAGVDMNAIAEVDGLPMITLHHPQQIEPELAGVATGDYITIQGNPPIKMKISPEVSGGVGTIAICVNMIPHVINARPGLKTMIDLPVPRAIVGDVRSMIEGD